MYCRLRKSRRLLHWLRLSPYHEDMCTLGVQLRFLEQCCCSALERLACRTHRNKGPSQLHRKPLPIRTTRLQGPMWLRKRTPCRRCPRERKQGWCEGSSVISEKFGRVLQSFDSLIRSGLFRSAALQLGFS